MLYMPINRDITLPQWLDNIIFNKFGAVYERRPEEVMRTPDNSDFDKIYLGTYFPRSYAEAYCIMGQLLNNRNYMDAIAHEQELNILDFCCGTGGEILGLISILQENLPNLKRINIDAFDANEMYIYNIYHILEEIKERITIDVSINPQCIFVENEQHLDDIVSATSHQYHIILSFKALNEFIQGNTFPDNNIYKMVAEKFLPLLADNGILILSDLTNKYDKGNFFYPVKMNEGFNYLMRANKAYKSIFPFTCYHYEHKCRGCYMQDVIYVTHSRKIRDISKVAYRIIGKSNFAAHIVANIKPNICRYANSQADRNAPYNI